MHIFILSLTHTHSHTAINPFTITLWRVTPGAVRSANPRVAVGTQHVAKITLVLCQRPHLSRVKHHLSMLYLIRDTTVYL